MARGSRERARGLLVKALYQWQLAGHSEQELLEQYEALAEYSRIDAAYFCELLHHAITQAGQFDQMIAEHASRGLDQLDAVGRAILLLALSELKFRGDVPVKVVINEAVNLARRYGPAESYRFVNALIDKLATTLRSQADTAAG